MNSHIFRKTRSKINLDFFKNLVDKPASFCYYN